MSELRFEDFNLAPGKILVALDPKLEMHGDFVLPESETVQTGTIIRVGKNANFILRVLRIPLFAKPGQRVVVGQVLQRFPEHVIVDSKTIYFTYE